MIDNDLNSRVRADGEVTHSPGCSVKLTWDKMSNFLGEGGETLAWDELAQPIDKTDRDNGSSSHLKL